MSNFNRVRKELGKPPNPNKQAISWTIRMVLRRKLPYIGYAMRTPANRLIIRAIILLDEKRDAVVEQRQQIPFELRV